MRKRKVLERIEAVALGMTIAVMTIWLWIHTLVWRFGEACVHEPNKFILGFEICLLIVLMVVLTNMLIRKVRRVWR